MVISAALGTFDGLHKGHIAVLKKALENENAICITFNYPPNAENGFILQPHIKLKRLQEMGFKQVISFDFSKVKDMKRENFLDLLKNKYGVTEFCCGFDYHFGKDGLGNTEYLKEYVKKHGLTATVIPPYCKNGVKVSSTNIRKFIESGELAKANDWLSQPYSLELPVIHGDARGRTIGYPTLNQLLPKGICAPRFGVYISKVEVAGAIWRGITNIGIRPTYLTKTPSCETYVMGFKGDAYGMCLKLIPEKFIRGEEKFDSLDKLKSAIAGDIQLAEYIGDSL